MILCFAGKGKKIVLQSNDEIALPTPGNTAYIFRDLKATREEQEVYPQVNVVIIYSQLLDFEGNGMLYARYFFARY